MSGEDSRLYSLKFLLFLIKLWVRISTWMTDRHLKVLTATPGPTLVPLCNNQRI